MSERATVSRYLSSARYSYQDQTKRDVMNVLEMYRNLKPCLEKCTLPTGVKRDLLCLKGTIPVTYRNNVYNIPVSLWVLNNHPESAPICWVNPTKDMTIKVSRNVDEFGRIYLPYLSEWDRNSDLLSVIQVMIIVFGETPPLYSKPKNTTTETATSSVYSNVSVNASMPNPPYPGQYSNQYPYTSVYPAMNPITSMSSASYSQASQPANATPNPAYPFSSYPMMSGYNQSSVTPVSADSISKEHIRLSLLSAVEDKLKARSKEIVSQYNAEIDVLKKTGNDLKKGRGKLDNLVKEIENNLVELSKCKEKILEKDAKLTELLSKLETSKSSLNIDECFGPVQPLYKQLLNAFVEENSIVDTIFYLNEALQKGVINLDVFIKHVRELSRRQFMMRALIKLCREKAGLPT